jgi:hypothetical protein
MLARAPLLLLLAVASPLPGQAAAPPLTLEGRIVDVLGDPIAAAKVTALANGRVVGTATAEGEGIYRIRVPQSGAWLHFDAAGKVQVRLAWRGPTTPKVRNVVLEDGATLSGRLTDGQGQGMAHAMVVFASSITSGTTISDANGRYELHGVPLREVLLRAVAADGWCEATLRLQADTVHDLVLAPHSGTCFVQMRDLPAGAGRGAVRIFGSDLSAVIDNGNVLLPEDAAVRLLLRNWCLVEAKLPGHVVSPSQQFAGRDTARIDFVVKGTIPAEHGTLLRGHVRTSTGRGVEGVRVVVRDRSQRDLGVAHADRDGAFHLRVVLPGDGYYRAGVALTDWLLIDGAATVVDGFAWVPPTTLPEAIELLVERAGTLREVVRGPTGMQFALADIVIADGSRPHKPLVHVLSDVGARIDLGLPPGSHELIAIAHDGQVCRAEVEIVGGEPVQPKWVAVPTGTVEGRLLDQNGKPLPGVDLFLADESLRGGGDVRACDRQSCRIVTDRHGRFRCRGLPIGFWTIVALDQKLGVAGEVEIKTGGVLACDLVAAR